MYKFLTILMILISQVTIANQELTDEQLQAWFDSDEMELPTPKVVVNDGELVFLDSPPDKPALHSTNIFVIDHESLEDGWLQVFQCFKNLDAMAESEIVYKNEYLRQLKIDSSENIEKAFVADNTVQMINVTRPAKLCVSAEVRNLQQINDEHFVLMNGPYHRRFLDGYFPFELTMEVRFPESLKFLHSNPAKQNGFDIDVQDQRVVVNTLFEGMLFTELTFARKTENGL